ncbi:MAG: OmpA family protein [Bryobacterales bacterium]|jgi:chemotaxis protein MotB|nr:OmpA family protein [Bryobacterales bacterium]
MARKQRHEEHPNHERWMVSYADFVTLLFAFFVVMYATARVDESAPLRVSESVREALKEDSFQALVNAFVEDRDTRAGRRDATNDAKRKAKGDGGKADAVLLQQFLPSMDYLSRELATEIREDQVSMRLTRRGLVISLRQAAFFPSGQDIIAPETYEAIGKVAQTIAKLPNHVRLEGHTDSIPIRNARFPSNWHLSTARAISMLELLIQRFQLPKEKFTVAGYADTISVDSNETEVGRRRNRRVDIVVLNLYGLGDEPLGSDQAQDEVIHRLAEDASPARPAPSR